jgi:hypothetical protein
MPRPRKRQRKSRVEVSYSAEQDARLERLAIELELSKAEVLLLALTDEGRHRIEQAEQRIKARDPDMKSKALAASNWRARGRRSERHLEQKPTEAQREQKRKEAEAKGMLEAGRSFYDVEAATGLSRLEVTELEKERRAENEAGTRAALDEMRDRLKDDPEAGRDELARRIAALRGEKEEEDEPEQQYSSLHELNVEPIQRFIY